MGGKIKVPDYIRMAGASDDAASAPKATYGIATGFNLRSGQTYSITARKLNSKNWGVANVFGGYSSKPSWSGTQYYYVGGGYLNTTGISVSKKTIAFTNRDPSDTEVELNIYGASNGGAANFALYNFMVRDNGEVVFDAIPAIDKEGNVCLYEKISKRYLYGRGGKNVFAGGYDE